MKKEPFVLDDRVIIPEYIQKMTKEELKAEIARLEKEIQEEKKKKKAEKSTDVN